MMISTGRFGITKWILFGFILSMITTVHGFNSANSNISRLKLDPSKINLVDCQTQIKIDNSQTVNRIQRKILADQFKLGPKTSLKLIEESIEELGDTNKKYHSIFLITQKIPKYTYSVVTRVELSLIASTVDTTYSDVEVKSELVNYRFSNELNENIGYCGYKK